MIRKIEPVVVFRDCPGCGYRMTQLEVDRMRFNPKCPRCHKHTAKEFVPKDKDGRGVK